MINCDIENQSQHFNNIALRYYQARQHQNHKFYKKLLWEYFSTKFYAGKSCLREKKYDVLEPMCGYAEGKFILEKYFNLTINYEGFDYSEKLVSIVKQGNPLINIYQTDITKFNPTKKYDLVIIIGGLHHVPAHIQKILHQIYNTLNNSGYFINFEPTHNNFLFKNIREYIYRKNTLFDETTEKSFDLNQLNTLYKNSGFDISYQCYPGLLSYILYYNPDAFANLNVGNKHLIKFIFNIDKAFFTNFLGRIFSFATLTLLKKTSN